MSLSTAARQQRGGMGAGTHHTALGAAAAAYSHGFGAQHDTLPASNGISNGVGVGPRLQRTSGELDIVCGPLLNYRHMSGEHTANPTWHGSVLIVTTPGSRPEKLRLNSVGASSANQEVQGAKLYQDPHKAFWQFSLEVPFQEQESHWEYLIPRMTSSSNTALSTPKRFSVPSKHESMRIMFHSCNGFSVGTDEDAWSGPALWNDVLRMHAQQPFHVMIGGGDQIYNDGVRVDGPLRAWTDIGNPKKRREFPFGEDMRATCDEYYFDNYVRWYGMEPFASANGQIPQL